ncbi:MAG: uroporphyrinogen-III synthase [Xanthomonadales bacterium]|nr:uroporphyrinogen-III synthase [Xanthomonadales bacterium]
MTHVLITRPYDASQQLADQLVVQGLFPVVMPFYTFKPRKPDIDISSAWSASGARKLAVFTSPRAVQFGLPLISRQDPIDDLEVAVVGSATRASLEAAGYQVHLQAKNGFTSEDLLQIPGLAERAGVAIIFCAPGGRGALAEGLVGLGWNTLKAMVYERVPLQPEPGQVDCLRDAGDLISTWTSISALKLAEEYLPRDLWGKILNSPALVISSRIQHYLSQRGASSVELADGPGNPDLLQSVLRLTQQQTAG